ncbi:hypothetical protein IMCC9480_911 [Oxalobacteraceae bacterium IMCC9480]|nr:hypothetical protein IMCC9480_911 [Oxalobacteraceae bacterium IMCC9480]
MHAQASRYQLAELPTVSWIAITLDGAPKKFQVTELAPLTSAFG